MFSHASFGRHRVLVAVVAAGATLAACSSTNAKKAGGLSPEGTPTPGASGTASAPPGLVPSPGATAVSSASASAAGVATRGPAGGATGATSGGTTGTVPGVTGGTGHHTWTGPVGPGVTATTIKIGISTFKIGDFAKNLGVNVDVGDNQAQANAVIAYINSHGGIAGRKVIPSFYEVDFTRANGTDGAFEAAACEKWTNDDKVFAAINASLQRQQLLPCLAKKDVLAVHNGLQIDEARMSPYRQWYYATNAGSGTIQDRAAHTEDKMLCGRGWFKNATVGIIYYDEPAMRWIVDHIYEPEIKACGGKAVVKQAAGRGLTTADQTYVARFQSAGVTNVMFLGEGGAYPYTFMPAAQNQLYFPKYSLRSDQAPAIQLAAAQVPPDQLKNSIGIGWSPMQDVDAGGDPGPTNAADKLCLDIFKKASISMTDRGARLAAMVFCSGLFFLQQALNNTTSVTSKGVAEAVAKMGTSFTPPETFDCRFSGTQHDCPSVYRVFAYNFQLKKFRYITGNQPMQNG